MKRFQVWPLANVDGEWSVPDAVLIDLWNQIVLDGRAWKLFYTGKVLTVEDWLYWIKLPANIVNFVVDTREKKIACVSWINSVDEGTAQLHFCMIGAPHPEIGIEALKYYSTFDGLKVLVGLTPEHYSTAIRYAKRIGFTAVGLIPNVCNMAFENRRVGAVVTHYQVGKES